MATQKKRPPEKLLILATVPAVYTQLRGLHRLPGTPNPFRTPSTIYHSSAPPLPPPSPYPYLPCVRLHCTMPCYGTPRVRVLECPPLGRPSLIKLVLVKRCYRSVTDRGLQVNAASSGLVDGAARAAARNRPAESTMLDHGAAVRHGGRACVLAAHLRGRNGPKTLDRDEAATPTSCY